jgi:FAD:protein FMN transferase
MSSQVHVMSDCTAPFTPLNEPSATRRQFLALLSPCGADSSAASAEGGFRIRVHRRAMACRFEIILAAVDGAFVPASMCALDEVNRIERELSVFIPTSAISELNRRGSEGPVPVPEHVAELLAACQRIHRETGGAFDITTLPLSRSWGFLTRDARVPPIAVLDAARRLVGFDAVRISHEPPAISFSRPGVELNLGAVGKGYALERASAVLRASGVSNALLSAGRSSIVAHGGRGDGWRVEIVSALSGGRPLVTLVLRNAALGTSGAGEQFVIEKGRRYGHVIDPRTGWPAHGVLGATVVTSDAARADALSTAFLVGGLELARRYCAEHHDVLALITPDDGSERPIVIGSYRGARVVFN